MSPFASVTVDLQGHEDLDVFIRRADGTTKFVATLSMFGHHLMHGPVTFHVPLSDAIATLQAAQNFRANPTLKIQVVPRTKSAAGRSAAEHGHAAAPTSEVTAISLQQL